MKKLLTVLLAGLMLVTITACGKKEEHGGSLVIYSPNSDALVDVTDVFAEKYGIEVEVLSMGTGECLERIVSEKDNPLADVLYGGLNYANTISYKDYFEPYVAAGDDKLPEAYQNTGGIATHYCLDGSAALLVNVDEYTKLGLDINEFKGYQDLMRPELKDHIAMGDPAKSSSAWAELTNMLLVMGDQPYDEAAWKWVEGFIGQFSAVLSSSSAIYKGTVSGEYVVGVSYEDPCVGLLVNGAENVKLVYPEEGAVWLPAGAGIVKNAPNMKNAKLFMDWLISEEGQNEIAKTTARPVNTEIANTTDKMLPFSQINVAYEDIALCGENKKQWQARWTDIFNQVHPN